MWNKLAVYFLAFNIAFAPVQRANAIAPALAVAWGIEVAVPAAIRYLGTEIAINAVVKTVQASNYYYSGTAALSNSKYMKYFKGKLGLGVAGFTAAAAALGWSMTNDDTLVSQNSQVIGGYIQGYVYGSCGSFCPKSYYEDINTLATDFMNYGLLDLPNKQFEISPDGNRWRVNYYADRNGNPKHLLATKYYYSYSCEDDNLASLQSCAAPVVPDNITEVSEAEFYSALSDYLDSLEQEEQYPFFGDASGVIDTELTGDDGFLVDGDHLPLLPSGAAVPNRETDAWIYADRIANGVAQSDDASAVDTYVPSDQWDESYYLANVVANGNDYITGLNAGTITAPDENVDTENPPVAGGATVDLTGIESRIDTTNEINQKILDEISGLSTASNVPIQAVPDETVSASFWTVRYPDGIQGVLTDFIDNMKKTPIFEWLDDFVIDLGAGSIPAFDLCFNTIAGIDFGCYTLQADAYIWSAIKACMILFAVIVSRRIVFGG